MVESNSNQELAPILVVVDFSDYSYKALIYAAKLAEALSRSLKVLHVVHDPGDAPGYYSKSKSKKKYKKKLLKIEESAADMFADFIDSAVKEHSSTNVLRDAEMIQVNGLPVTRILEVEEKLKPYMLVMGSQGRTGLAHLMLGSKAEQVVQLAKSPITIIK